MKRYSLLVQLVVYVMVTTLLLLSIVGAAYYRTSAEIIRETTEQNTQNMMAQSGEFVQAYLAKLKKITTSLAENEQVKSYAKETTDQKAEDLRQILNLVLSTDPDLVSALVVTKSGHLLATDESISMQTSSDMMEETWYKAAIQEHAMPVLTPARQNNGQTSDKWVISITQEVVDTQGNNLAVIRLDIAYDTLSRYLDSLQLGENGFTFIVNRQHEFVYHPNKEVYSSSKEMNALKPYILIENGYVKEGRFYVYQAPILQSDWILIGVVSMETLEQLKSEILMAFVVIGLLALGIFWLGIGVILRHWIKPLRELQGTILAIENGEVHLRAKEWGAPELVDLSHQFNRMLDQIERLMLRVKEEEQHVRQYELHALSSQINPHFLYNTLDTIVWMAEFNDSQKVVEMTKSLAKYFRLALNQGNEQIALKDEIDHVRQYLFIQKQRYGDKLTYEIIENPKFDAFSLPKLVLQPLVENAIYHGIKETDRQGLIRISVQEEAGSLCIAIQDNGVGFQAKEKEGTKLGGVGLNNVDQRLSLQFGEDYHMEIETEPMKGSKVTLFFSIEKKRAGN